MAVFPISPPEMVHVALAEDAFGMVSDRVKSNICEFLPLSDLGRLGIVSKRWNTYSIQCLTNSRKRFIEAIIKCFGDKISPEDRVKFRGIANDTEQPFKRTMEHKKAMHGILSSLNDEAKISLYKVIEEFPHLFQDIITSLRYKGLQTVELCTIAKQYIRAGRVRRSLEVANLIPHEHERLKAEIYCDIAQAYIEAGDLRQALKIADSIHDSDPLKGGILRSIVSPYTKAGDLKGALAIITDSISGPLVKTLAFRDIVQAYIEAGDLEKALAIITDSISDPAEKTSTLLNLALAEYYKTWDQARVRMRIEEVLEIVDSISDSDKKSCSFTCVARRYIEIRDLEKSLEIADLISSAASKSEVISAIARAYICTGNLERVYMLLDRALEIVDSIADAYLKSSTLNCIARVYIEAKDLERARMVLAQAFAVADSIADDGSRCKSSLLSGYSPIIC
ncbi:MAG: hypothetical protein K9M07_01950 [Simkaniaceae bacterium]|nr:hypothetical protein [Simkaniaceae bacterium]MCF7851984.1 hypothetical protein [Simkaniaceae bacterium]